MADRRKRNVDWNVADEKGELWSSIKDGCLLAVAMDIRDELQTLNRLLACPNFTGIPETLRKIRRNTANLPKVKKGNG